MLNGLDLFSGIGGLTLALQRWVRPVAYCEIDRYAQAVLLSRMRDGQIATAPVWDDVTTLLPSVLPRDGIDIIYGGFPCQDISIAGNGKGLEGKRSGLFFEIMRLVDEIQPPFIFLENVPAITTRGLAEVAAEITKRGYDCRWTIVSAAEVGANHLRKRWWLLAYADSGRELQQEGQLEQKRGWAGNGGSEMAHANSKGLQSGDASWWATEPNVGRVVNGLPQRVDRIKCLGNAVVPLQAEEAFKRLMGLDSDK